MEPTPTTSNPAVCPNCHQPVLVTYYFCPNCGYKLNLGPLSTSATTQAWIYGLSIILPFILYIGITRWPAVHYYKSADPKAKLIGTIAWTLMITSSIITIWLAYTWTQDAIQSTTAQINADFQ